ncbi:ParB/RepB/Spo0J family partition protein [Nesterenkonia sandarakina]|uniref:Chromosome segregation DNA-binding protein n=1 Tax=Nesterenkonia sandarakina TaxID=272918 RepID=A0A2T0YNB5_9MICC|nr:ParB/RepB/Spo0J family partition protein [Nesterenkonia sandarakina]PRZ16822.1 chromosome segregation DNA-binding protein [Nesterenkonia sandarakina]
MAERKRRGLGRGLGALINSDAQEAEAAEAAAVQSQNTAEAKDEAQTQSDASEAQEPTAPVSRETPESRTAAPRPIDVFFSAKSDLDRQVIARESATISRPSTASRRATGGQRAPMPDVLSRNGAKSAASRPSVVEDLTPSMEQSAVEVIGADPHVAENESPSTAEGAWTSAVSRETGGSVDGAEFRSIPVDSIVPNPRQPRQEFDEEHMDELIHSIREIGVLQPIVVRPAGPDHFELVMGERRWRASKAADRETVPAIVRMTADDDLLRDALLENIHRSQLNPLEEAAAYRQLLDDFNCTQDELAERIGRSRPQISNTLRLMKLPPAVQRRVAAGVLSAGHARALLGLKSQEQMDQLAGRIVAEGLSVRATEEAVTLAQRDQGSGDLGRERAKSPRVRQLEEFSDALTDRLDTQVKITLGAKKGRIAIDFGSIDDLHRLMEMIGSRS